MTRQTLLRMTLIGLMAASAVPAIAFSGSTPYKKADFEQSLKSNATVLVHVHADWCPTCRQQAKVLPEVLSEARFKGIKPVIVDYDMDGDFKKQYNVTGQSLIILFKNGKEVARAGGVTDKAKLTELVAKAL